MSRSFLKLYFILLFSYCFAYSSEVKAQVSKMKGLRIGDKVPDIALGQIINYKNTSARLADFKDKLLILDFWGIYCKTCIEQFPKYDLIQKEFPKDIQILLVAEEKKGVILPFWKENKITNRVHLPSVVGDKLLSKYFPHESMPHVVWIYKGVVKAITSYEYLKKDKVSSLLGNGYVNWPSKKDAINYNYEAPFLVSADNGLPEKPSTVYYSTLTSYLEGVSKARGGFKRDSSNNITRIYAINNTIPNLYRFLLGLNGNPILPTTTIIEIRDSMKYVRPKTNGERDAYTKEWDKKNCYSYETILPLTISPERIRESILIDLNRFLGLYGHFEKRNVSCLVLKKLPAYVKSNINKEGEGQDLEFYINYSISIPMNLPVVNESGYNGKIEMSLNSESLDKLKESLLQYGFELVHDTKEIEMLIISELAQQN